MSDQERLIELAQAVLNEYEYCIQEEDTCGNCAFCLATEILWEYKKDRKEVLGE